VTIIISITTINNIITNNIIFVIIYIPETAEVSHVTVSVSASRPHQRHHRQRRRPARDGRGVTCDGFGSCLTALLPQDCPNEIHEGSSRSEDEKVSHVTALLFLLLLLLLLLLLSSVLSSLAIVVCRVAR